MLTSTVWPPAQVGMQVEKRYGQHHTHPPSYAGGGGSAFGGGGGGGGAQSRVLGRIRTVNRILTRFISQSGFQNKFSDRMRWITCERAYSAKYRVEDEEMMTIGCRPTTPPTSQTSTRMSTRQPSSTNENQNKCRHLTTEHQPAGKKGGGGIAATPPPPKKYHSNSQFLVRSHSREYIERSIEDQAYLAPPPPPPLPPPIGLSIKLWPPLHWVLNDL
jgi:hypothetical protein